MTYYKRMRCPTGVTEILFRAVAEEVKKMLVAGEILCREWVEGHKDEALLGVVQNGCFMPYYTEKYYVSRMANKNRRIYI